MGIRRRSKQIASTVSHGHIVSTQSAIEGDGAFHYDSTSGKKALAAVAPELEALGDDLVVVRIDVQKSAYAALEVARHVQSPEVRSRFAELPVQAFDMRNADGLGEIAMATIFRSVQITVHAGPSVCCTWASMSIVTPSRRSPDPTSRRARTWTDARRRCARRPGARPDRRPP